MLRVLHVLGGLGTGGTESLIMNWYRNIDREKLQFDFLVRSDDTNYTEEIKALGGRVYFTASYPRHFLRNYRETKAVLAKKEWDVIHVHGNAAMYMLPLRLAKKMGYPCRIMHSHSVKARNPVFSFIHSINKKRLSAYASHCLACSEAAGEWMFSPAPYRVLSNAIDAEKSRFDDSVRQEIRKAYHIEDCYVVGHVGRFAVPKNHAFLLEAFAEFHRMRADSILMLVGDGELEEEIKAKAAQMELLDSILFMGRRSDVGKLMSAMDLFVLPSVYEGLGIVLVEAQFSGLPCIVSEEAFHEEVRISPTLSTISLQSGAEVWASHMLRVGQQTAERSIDAAFVKQSGYDIRTEAAKLEAFYLHAAKGKKP